MQRIRELFARTDGWTRFFVIALLLFFYVPFVYKYGFKYLHIEHVDFPSFYWGARVALVFHHSPYMDDAFYPYERILDQHIWPFLYPPASLLLFYPFTWFGYETAKHLMLVLNHLAFLAVVYLLLVRLKLVAFDLSRAAGVALFVFLVTYLLFFRPVVMNLNHGQINLIVLTLLGFAWARMKEHKPPAATGVLVGFAVLLKTYPLLFLPMLVLKRRYAVLGYTLLVLAVAHAVAYLALPHVVWSDWFNWVLPYGGYGREPANLFPPAEPNNQSLNGFAARLFIPNVLTAHVFDDPALGRLLAYALAAIMIGATYLAIYLAERRRRDATDLEFALLLMVMFAVGPFSWIHHLVYALPALFLLVGYAIAHERKLLLGGVLLPIAFVMGRNLPFDFPSLERLGGPLALALGESLRLYAVLALWLFALVLLVREVRAARVADAVLPGATVLPLRRKQAAGDS